MSPATAAPRPGTIADAARASGRVEPRVVLLKTGACCPTEAWPEAERATRDELHTLGLTVVTRPSQARDEGSRRRELQQAARKLRAFCALRILRVKGGSRSAVELSLRDQITQKTLWRSIVVDPGAPGAASLVALRVVELLRASLLELRLHGRAGPPSLPPAVRRFTHLPKRPRAPRPGPGRRWALRFGLGAMGSPGGVGGHGQLELGLRFTPLPRLALELTANVTAFGADVVKNDLQASSDVGATTLWAIWELRSRGRLRPALGLGAGVLWLWSSGRAAPGVVARTDAAAAAHVAARAELGLVLRDWLWLRLGFTAGIALPEIELRFLGERVAGFGLPVLAVQIGIEIRL